MKTKLKYIIPMLMITMTACASPSESKETLTASSAVTGESADTLLTEQVNGSFPKRLDMEIDRVKFDAEVLAHSAENMKAKSYEATLRKFDKEKLKEKFFSSIEEPETISNDDPDSFYGKKDEFLSVYPTGIFFYTDFHRYVKNTFSLFEDDRNAEMYMKDTDFDFASRDEAKEIILKELDGIGAGLGSDYFINMYSLDYETMKENEEVLDVNDEIENDTGILLENDDGRVLITRRTIRSLVNSVIFRTDEIIDAKIIVDINADNEVSVKLAIDVIQGVAIKNVTSKLQSDIKNMVKETTDITIKSVDIDVKEYIDIDSNEDDEDTIDEIDDMETNAKKSRK